MKKFTVVLLLLFSLSIGAFAQSPFRFGIDGGLNLSNSSVDSDGGDKKAKLGFQIGLVAEYQLESNFFLQSGLSFTTKGFKFDYTDFEEGYDNFKVKATFNQMYLQLPIYAGYKLDITPDAKLVFNLGPYLAYGIGGKYKLKALGEEEKDDIFGDDLLKRFDFGFGAGAGVEFLDHYFAGFKYELGITDISRGSDSYRNRNASITIGYRF